VQESLSVESEANWQLQGPLFLLLQRLPLLLRSLPYLAPLARWRVWSKKMVPVLELYKTRASTPGSVFASMQASVADLNVAKFDVYGDFSETPATSYLRRFEAQVAGDLGKEDALFVPSGVMAQNIALCINKEESSAGSNSFACSFSSHLLLHEQEGYKALLGQEALVVQADQDSESQRPLPLTLHQKVEPILQRHGPHAPHTLVVEVPEREIGGKCAPLKDLRALSASCKTHGVKLHCDGARLWEATSFYCNESNESDDEREEEPVTLQELCGLFDSVYVSFYKGIGASTGAMLLGTTPFIAKARVYLRRFGGNLFTQAPFAIDCMANYALYKAAFPARKEKLCRVVAAITAELADLDLDGSRAHFVRFDPPVPDVNMVHVYFQTDRLDVLLAAREAAIAKTGSACFAAGALKRGAFGAANQSYFELTMGATNEGIELDKWVAGWRGLAEETVRLLRE